MFYCGMYKLLVEIERETENDHLPPPTINHNTINLHQKTDFTKTKDTNISK